MLDKLAYSLSTQRGHAASTVLFGKQAARDFLHGKTESLTEAAAAIARENDMGRHDVERLVEAANQATWEAGFHETQNGDFAFTPATYESVTERLNSQPGRVREPSPDYFAPPIGELRDNGLLVSHEPPEGQEKVASVQSVLHIMDHVALAQQEMDGRAEVKLHEAARLRDSLYQDMLDLHWNHGVGVLEMAKVAKHACQDVDFASDLTHGFVKYLETVHRRRYSDTEEMAKVASARIPQTEHPVYQKMQQVEKLAQEAVWASGKLHEYRTGHLRLVDHLKARL